MAALLAKEAVVAESKPAVRFLPLVQVSGTTAPSGELKLSPSMLIYLSPQADLQVSPIFKAATKEGSVTLDLNQPSSSNWSAGGGLVVHVLHPVYKNGNCNQDPGGKHCPVLRAALELCDREFDVRPTATCEKKQELMSDADQRYCELRPGLEAQTGGVPAAVCSAAEGETDLKRVIAVCDEALAVRQPYTCKKAKADDAFCKAREPVQGNFMGYGKLCDRGKAHFDANPPREAYLGGYPLAQVYLGGLVGTKQYEWLTLDGGVPGKMSEARTSSSVVGGFTVISKEGHQKLPLTVELIFQYRARSIPSSTPLRWCQDQGVVPPDSGSTAQSCVDGVLGPPTASESFAASLLFGGVDVVHERWRISAGPETTWNDLKKTRGLGVKVPTSIRLTPGTGNSGYLGDYKGVLRITPTLGWDWNEQGERLGMRMLLVLDLLGQQDLFGSALTGL